MRFENTWREIRDHSFIQNHSRSFRFTDPWRCFFSSSHSSSTGFRSEDTWWETRDIPSSRITPDPLDSQIHDGASSVHLTHLLQGSGQRTPDERSEIIPSSRITPGPLDSQIHDGASSVHLTHLLQGSGQRTPDKRSEIIPSSRITPGPSDSQIHDGASSVHLTHVLQGSGQRTPDERSEIIPSSRITPGPLDSQIHDGASSVHLTHVLQGSGQRTPDERSETFLHPESLQILQIHRSMTVLLQFTHSCSTGFRSENTWWEIIPSSRITPDPSDSQIHDGASSVHLTHVLQGSGQRTGMTSRSLVLCSVTHLCCFWGLCLDYCPVGRSKHGPL